MASLLAVGGGNTLLLVSCVPTHPAPEFTVMLEGSSSLLASNLLLLLLLVHNNDGDLPLLEESILTFHK